MEHNVKYEIDQCFKKPVVVVPQCFPDNGEFGLFRIKNMFTEMSGNSLDVLLTFKR